MSSEADERGVTGRIRSELRDLASAPVVAMLLVGVVTGASLSVLGTESVAVPVVGSVPGVLAGAAGLAVAAVGYRWAGAGCNCDGDCGDSCSYEP